MCEASHIALFCILAPLETEKFSSHFARNLPPLTVLHKEGNSCPALSQKLNMGAPLRFEINEIAVTDRFCFYAGIMSG